MPWQSAPPLIIIGGAFAATGFLLRGVDWMVDGQHRRVQIDEFDFNMDKRDKFLVAQKAAADKIAAQAAKNS
jgi:hypothetical protein